MLEDLRNFWGPDTIPFLPRRTWPIALHRQWENQDPTTTRSTIPSWVTLTLRQDWAWKWVTNSLQKWCGTGIRLVAVNAFVTASQKHHWKLQTYIILYPFYNPLYQYNPEKYTVIRMWEVSIPFQSVDRFQLHRWASVPWLRGSCDAPCPSSRPKSPLAVLWSLGEAGEMTIECRWRSLKNWRNGIISCNVLLVLLNLFACTHQHR